MKRLSFLNKILYFLNWVAVATLGLSYFAPFADPTKYPIFALLGLGYLALLFINTLFVVYWLLNSKRHFLLSLAVIIIGFPLFVRNIVFFKNSEFEAKNSMKIMTYNVRNFDLYNWKDNKGARDNMLKFIREQNPDIINFQEFYSQEESELHNIKKLVNDLEFPYYYFEKSITVNGTKHWGLATFSKYPILQKNRIKFDNSETNLITYCDVQVKDKVFRVFNAHLQSIHFKEVDYKFFSDINEDKKPDIESFRNILSKLDTAFKKRSQQAKKFAAVIKESIYPVIVTGDFNDTPNSFTYQTLTRDLNDAFIESGAGIGNTYKGPLPAVLRIDYILTDSLFDVKNCHVIQGANSDHYPVWAEVGW